MLELVKPSDPAFSLPQIHQVMLTSHSNAVDPNNDFVQRYQNLRRAHEFAREYQRRTGSSAGISPDLLGTAAERNLLVLGQLALANYRHDMNTGKPEMAGNARIIIGYLAQDRLQSEEQSYALFGGRAAFDAVTQPSPGSIAANTPRPGDVISGTGSLGQKMNAQRNASAREEKLQLMDKIFRDMKGSVRISDNCYDITEASDTTTQIAGSGCGTKAKTTEERKY